ncbi:jun dimerization protein 2 isoform X2 [Vulpes lagopus]|nr:jun dimerization protein 2 isoform X2 [Vulpes lagopus]XP_041615041.1 jun dimerization protein 2 isoform X2 [Vulpes lagopus]XP_041615042.1 jun dimerization protein 2 isoform X2 [Vulpes lagopus]
MMPGQIPDPSVTAGSLPGLGPLTGLPGSALTAEELKYADIRNIGAMIAPLHFLEVKLGKRPQPVKSELDEEEERRKRRREKNKVAAARCRNKKKERTEFLQRGMGCKARPVGFPVAVSEDVWSVCCRPWVFTTALPGGFRVCVLAMYPVPIVTNAGIQDSRVHWAPAMPQSSVLGSPSPSSDLPRISCQVVTSKACAQSCSENQLCNLYEGQDPLAIRWAQTSMCWLGYELKGTYICQEWEIRVTPV